MKSTFQSIKSIFQHPELGLLLIRLVVGGILAFAGYSKFAAGTATLHAVGSKIDYLGLDVGSENVSTMFFGVLAAGSELVGGCLLVVGLLFRTSALFAFMTMLVATLSVVDSSNGDPSQFGYPMVMAGAVLGLLFTGPGRFAMQKD